MSNKGDLRRKSLAELTLQITKGDLYAMTEFARRHLEGDGMERDEMKAVEVLEDCAHSEIPDAMLMLAKCCALGRGIARDTRRARKLISDAAKRGNEEAGLLMRLFNELRQQHRVDLWSLYPTRSQENVASFILYCFLQRGSKENTPLSGLPFSWL